MKNLDLSRVDVTMHNFTTFHHQHIKKKLALSSSILAAQVLPLQSAMNSMFMAYLHELHLDGCLRMHISFPFLCHRFYNMKCEWTFKIAPRNIKSKDIVKEKMCNSLSLKYALFFCLARCNFIEQSQSRLLDAFKWGLGWAEKLIYINFVLWLNPPFSLVVID